MAQITESQLFETLGRVYAEVKALTTENTQLQLVVADLRQQLESKTEKKGKKA